MTTKGSHLETVRSAYRYVVAYERRVLDAVAAIDHAVEPLGFEAGRWSTRHRSFPTRASLNVHKWAWDNVPLYNARWSWALGGRRGNEAGNVWFFVDHIADTSFEAHSAPRGTEPDPLAHLAPSADADSLFCARWVKFGEPVEDRLWHKSWELLLAAHFEDTSISELWPEVLGRGPVTSSHKGVAVGGFAFSIGSIEKPEDFESGFIGPSVTVLRELTSAP